MYRTLKAKRELSTKRSITKNIHIHISQEQGSSVIEAVANKIFGENSNLLAQASQSVN
jgi:hypothetical protein